MQIPVRRSLSSLQLQMLPEPLIILKLPIIPCSVLSLVSISLFPKGLAGPDKWCHCHRVRCTLHVSLGPPFPNQVQHRRLSNYIIRTRSWVFVGLCDPYDAHQAL